MNTYTWTILRLDAYPTYEGVEHAVYSMHWRLAADDGAGHSAYCYGTQSAGPINPNDFTPFNELTEAQVLGWLEAAMGQEQIARIKADADAQIEQQINPTSESLPVPW